MRWSTGVLFVAACTGLNPAFDPAGDGGATGAASSGAGVTSGGGTSGAPTSGSEGGTAGLGGSSEGSEGAGDLSDGGTTVAPCPVCGECEACEGGVCVPAAGGACTQPVGVACETRLWGLEVETGDCRAYQAEAPTCVAPGVCDYPCAAPGAVVVDCDERCVRKDQNCEQGALIEQAKLGSVCVTNLSMTELCKRECVDNEGLPDHKTQRCSLLGQCEATFVVDCGYFVCSPDGGCPFYCDGPEDCNAPAKCTLTQCVP